VFAAWVEAVRQIRKQLRRIQGTLTTIANIKLYAAWEQWRGTVNAKVRERKEEMINPRLHLSVATFSIEENLDRRSKSFASRTPCSPYFLPTLTTQTPRYR